MDCQVIKLSLISSFGKRSNYPLKSVVFRIGCSIVFSFLIGLILVKIINRSDLPKDLPNLWAASLLGVFSYIVMGFMGFIVMSPIRGNTSGLYKQASLWPMSKATSLSLRLLPFGVTWFIQLIFMLLLSSSLASKLNLSLYLLDLTIIFCSLSGLAICATSRPSSMLLKIVIFSSVIFCSGFLTQKSFVDNKIWISGLALVLINLQLLLFFSIEKLTNTSSAKANVLLGSYFVTKQLNKFQKIWFSIKLFRNKRALNSFLFCIGLCLLIAAALVKRKILKSYDDIGWLVFSALLASAFACDIRGTLRVYKAPEILGPFGVGFFVKTEILTTTLLGMVIGSPLLLAIMLAHIQPVLVTLAYFIVIQTAATMIGLLSSTYFVPQAGDIGSQLFASVCSMGLLFGIPKILHFADYTIVGQIGGWIFVSLISVFVINIIELQRRKNYGSYRQVL